MDWSHCELIEVVSNKVSGVPIFKGTRLPASTVVDNVDAYMDGGLSLDQAIQATLESFPTVPHGAAGIRGVLSYREACEHQLAS